jgi:DNA-binding HxlR family transcriptional regulator
MRVLWELREPAPSFRALRERCDDVSSSVLWQRVNELKQAGLVIAPEGQGQGQGLRLTELGDDLLESFAPLQAFATRWAEEHAV